MKHHFTLQRINKWCLKFQKYKSTQLHICFSWLILGDSFNVESVGLLVTCEVVVITSSLSLFPTDEIMYGDVFNGFEIFNLFSFKKKEAEEYVIAIKLDDKSKMILCWHYFHTSN